MSLFGLIPCNQAWETVPSPAIAPSGLGLLPNNYRAFPRGWRLPSLSYGFARNSSFTRTPGGCGNRNLHLAGAR